MPRRKPKHRRPGRPVKTPGAFLMVALVWTWVMLLIGLPFSSLFVKGLANGIGPFFAAMAQPDFRHALKLTMMLSAVVVPINTLFGVVAAIYVTKNRFFGREIFISLLDLPFAISPVMTGMMFLQLYGRNGIFGPLIKKFGFNIVFAFPGMALATMFVTLPFVVRELLPLLADIDPGEDEAANTLGANWLKTFFRVTLPNIKWGLLHGVLLMNARAMGEFGAVSVVSGNIIGQTQTLTLFVESSYKEYNSQAAFTAAVLLALMAVITVYFKEKLEEKAAEQAALGK